MSESAIGPRRTPGAAHSILTVLEVLLTLVLAITLSAALFVTGYWVIVEERPITEALVAIGLPPSAATLEGADPAGPSPAAVTLALCFQAVAFGGLGLLMRWWRMPPYDPSRRSSLLGAVAMGLVAGVSALAATFVLSGLMALLGLDLEEQEWAVSLARDHPEALWSLAPLIVLVAPTIEEVFFRGYVFRLLREEVSAGVGYVVSTLLFGLIHFHPPALPVYLLYGLLLAWLYDRTSRLLAPVLAHMIINSTALAALLVAGGQPPV